MTISWPFESSQDGSRWSISEPQLLGVIKRQSLHVAVAVPSLMMMVNYNSTVTKSSDWTSSSQPSDRLHADHQQVKGAMLIFPRNASASGLFLSEVRWHLVWQLKRGFHQKWVPLISQFSLVFTFGKMERFCWAQKHLWDESVAGGFTFAL